MKPRANLGAHRDDEAEERRRREAALDKTIEASFPASDPPSTDPNPDVHDGAGSGRQDADALPTVDVELLASMGGEGGPAIPRHLQATAPGKGATLSTRGRVSVMEPRIDYGRRFPELRQAMLGLEHYVHESGLESTLLELVRLRASLINGCAYCVDMHTKVARSHGETEQRLYELSLWREAPFYTERERAALEWAEAVTLVSADHVPDDAYERVRRHFDEPEMVALTAAVVAINGWNRLAIAFRTVPGTFSAR